MKKKRENKVIDFLNMPACFSSLFLHLLQQLTLCVSLTLPDITDHRWDEDGRIRWIQQSFPDDTPELLMFDNDIDDDSENAFEDYGSDIENDSEEDKSGD